MSAIGYHAVRDHVLEKLRAEAPSGGRWDDAAALIDLLVLGDFQEFLTQPGYRLLDRTHEARAIADPGLVGENPC